MAELLVIGAFFAALIACLAAGWPILAALGAGYALFAGYALGRGFLARDVLKMSWSGLRLIRTILVAFMLIGLLTATWRDCGTVAWIIYRSSPFVVPSAFYLATFLLCSLVSVLTGTSVGSSATMGVICMAIAKAMGADPALTGGAIISGVYFGDRCSPMSTSALLVCAVTGTEIYGNIKNMARSCVGPFALAGAVYFLLGRGAGGEAAGLGVWGVFADNFDLAPAAAAPAAVIVALCAARVEVKKAMLASIAVACAVSLWLQRTPPAELGWVLLRGFRAHDPRLAPLLDGGGLGSMAEVGAIVCLSSCYSGIFEATGLLKGLKARVVALSRRVGPYGATLVTSVVANMLACNQTLPTMLVQYLCREVTPEPRQLALDIENTSIVIAGLVPWSVAAAVPLALTGAPLASLTAAVYLYSLPLWGLARRPRAR